MMGAGDCVCTHTGCSHDANYLSLCFRTGRGWIPLVRRAGHTILHDGCGGLTITSVPGWILSRILSVSGKNIISQSDRIIMRPIRVDLLGPVPCAPPTGAKAPRPRSNVPQRTSTGQVPPHSTGSPSHLHVRNRQMHPLTPPPVSQARDEGGGVPMDSHTLSPPPPPLLQPPRPSPVTSAHTPGQAPAAVPAGWGPGSPAQLG